MRSVRAAWVTIAAAAGLALLVPEPPRAAGAAGDASFTAARHAAIAPARVPQAGARAQRAPQPAPRPHGALPDRVALPPPAPAAILLPAAAPSAPRRRARDTTARPRGPPPSLAS
jgi:hypothetical protein